MAKSRRQESGRRDRLLFSILCFVRNRNRTIARCVESVLAQEPGDFELVVQDGASTDGTLETLRRYSDPRIRLQSRSDDGPEQGFFRALERCRGRYLGICQSDEELTPGALRWASDHFEHHPELGAVYGDAELIDYEGNSLGLYRPERDFTFERFLLGEIRPIWSSSFFRLDAVRQSGMRQSAVPSDTEMFMRVAGHFPVRYFPGVVSRYGIDRSAFSSSGAMILDQIEDRMEGIRRVLRETPQGRRHRELEIRAQVCWLLWYAECLLCNGEPGGAAELLSRALTRARRDPRRESLLARARFLLERVFGTEPRPDSLEQVGERIAGEIRTGGIEKPKRLIRFLQDTRPLGLDPWVKLDRITRITHGLPTPRYDPWKYPLELNLISQWIRRRLESGSCISRPLGEGLIPDVYIYGGGLLGRNLHRDCRLAGVSVRGVIDGRGSEIQPGWHPLPVHEPGSIAERTCQPALFVLALFRPDQEQEALDRLAAAGVEPRRITSWKELLHDTPA